MTLKSNYWLTLSLSIWLTLYLSIFYNLKHGPAISYRFALQNIITMRAWKMLAGDLCGVRIGVCECFNWLFSSVQCCLAPTDTVRTSVRDREPRTATSNFTQLVNTKTIRNRMTASVLKQDPNTKVQSNAYLCWQGHIVCIISSSHNTTLKQQING